MAREEIGSWLSGPKAALESQGLDLGYPGQRLGFPESGPGSMSSVGRKAVALIIDWMTAVVIAKAFSAEVNPDDASMLALQIYAIQILFSTILSGASFGQRLMGIGVTSLDGKRLTVSRVVARTALICLVIPAVIYDRDNRGLHDKAVNSVVVRTR